MGRNKVDQDKFKDSLGYPMSIKNKQTKNQTDKFLECAKYGAKREDPDSCFKSCIK